MKCKRAVSLSILVVSVIAVIVGRPWTWAESEPGPGGVALRMEEATPSVGDPKSAEMLIQEFQPFFGEHTAPIVTGLLEGTSITLRAESKRPDGSTVVDTLVMIPSLDKMQGNDVAAALTIAREQLRRLNISAPHPYAIGAALMGGTVKTPEGEEVKLAGVLALRSGKKSWEEIVAELGLKESLDSRDFEAASLSESRENEEEMKAMGGFPRGHQLVSGEPYPGFLKGVLVPMDGPVVEDELVLEAPGRRLQVERRVYRMARLASEELAGL